MSRSKMIQGWKCVSQSRYVHWSGVRLERRNPPKSGWYLVPADRRVPGERFASTPEGLDEALSLFASRRAVLEELTRIITKD